MSKIIIVVDIISFFFLRFFSSYKCLFLWHKTTEIYMPYVYSVSIRMDDMTKTSIHSTFNAGAYGEEHLLLLILHPCAFVSVCVRRSFSYPWQAAACRHRAISLMTNSRRLVLYVHAFVFSVFERFLHIYA